MPAIALTGQIPLWQGVARGTWVTENSLTRVRVTERPLATPSCHPHPAENAASRGAPSKPPDATKGIGCQEETVNNEVGQPMIDRTVRIGSIVTEICVNEGEEWRTSALAALRDDLWFLDLDITEWVSAEVDGLPVAVREREGRIQSAE